MSEDLFPEIDGEVVASEILMLRADSDHAILVVEGGDDEKLLWNFLDQDCYVVIAEGKCNALAAMGILEVEGVSGVVCVVDRDYDDFLGVNVANDNVIVNSFHDMESMVLRSAALPKVLREFGSIIKLNRINEDGTTVLEVLESFAKPLGVLRLISARDGLSLKFSGLSLRSYARQNLNLDEDKLCRDLKNHSQSHLTIGELRQRLNHELGAEHCPHMICCGHDLTSLLGKALQGLLGTNNATHVEKEKIELALRLAFSWEDFSHTEVFAQLEAWQMVNNGYRILRAA